MFQSLVFHGLSIDFQMQNFFESILKYIESISSSFKTLSIALKFKKLQKTLKVFQVVSMYFQYDRH